MRLKYRPEIDGLRAIAVLLVIFYHAELSFFEKSFFDAGFIGVDIFFVISGYLITSLIFRELEENKSFLFLPFYERRVRRLLPALFFVMLFTLPLAWVYLLPGDFLDYSKSILYSVSFSSNLYFYFSGLEYGATDSLYKPFLHTWSLSVEEQYYIIFPILFICAFKYFKKYILKIIVTTLILSLFMADWTTKNYPSVSFYFLHTRMWELLAGSILAYFEIYRNIRIKSIFVSNIGTIFGLSFIVFYLFFFNESISHPSFLSSIPVAGVCLIIFFSTKNDYVTRILSSKPFVGVGLISYSLYLWHFPIFAFARIKDNTPSEYDKFEWIILTLILSIITFFLVEKFFKNRVAISKKKLFYSILAMLFLILSSNFYVIYKNGFSYKYQISKNYSLDKKIYFDQWADFNKKIGMPDFNENNKTKILIVGNSHANDTFNSFFLNKDLFNKEEFSIINVHVACFNFFLKNKDVLPLHCKQAFSGKNISTVESLFLKSNIIVISTRWSDDDILILDEFISKLKNNKKKVILLNSSLEMNTKIRRGFNILDFFVFRNKRLPNSQELDKIEKEMFIQINNNKITDSKLKEIAKNNNIKILLKENYLCDLNNKRCEVLIDKDKKIFWDYSHYTLEGAKHLGKKIYNKNWFKY